MEFKLTEILQALREYPADGTTVQELTKRINPPVSFCAELSQSSAYEKVQQLIITENLILLRDRGLVHLSDTHQVTLCEPSASQISFTDLNI